MPAKQQNSTKLSNGDKNKRKAFFLQKSCIVTILFSPLLLILLSMYMVSLHNAVELPMKLDELKTLKSLVMSTAHGDIKIKLRDDLSAGSVRYIYRMAKTQLCRRCNFYRAEDEHGFLQGVVANKDVGFNTEKGACPEKKEGDNKSCHGPLLTKGMVAWIAGTAGGPHFMINNYDSPADWWGTQHTVFGEIQEPDSFQVLDTIFHLPRKEKDGQGRTLMEDEIPFEIRLE